MVAIDSILIPISLIRNMFQIKLLTIIKNLFLIHGLHIVEAIRDVFECKGALPTYTSLFLNS
ncbi:MAG: hypothetical protein DRJ49_03900 [Thermoprotei archaeon]|nr:MAG: hypothetical protein DRJ49_03900 [Thermoprotei archaeon]